MQGNRIAALVVLAALVPAGPAAAVDIDGQLDAAYGNALVAQTTQTGLGSGQITGDNSDGDLNYANGSELDGGYAFVSGGVLYLFLAGNVAMEPNVNHNQTVGHLLDLFVDSVPGGQTTLSGLGSGNPLNGLTFDDGFEPDYWFELDGDAGTNNSPPSWRALYAALPPSGSGLLVSLGLTYGGGPGTLVGGANPYGVMAAIDNRNTGGVTYGCGASSGAGVATGSEWAIPLAALGNPEGCFRIAVLLRDRSPSGGSPVSNQVLGPLPPGTCPPGQASTVNFANYAGDQFFTVCPGTAGVTPGGPAAGLALAIAGANPVRGDRLRVSYALPGAGPASLRLVDVAGRVVGAWSVRAADGGGAGTMALDTSRPLAPGMYWLRLAQGRASVTRGVCVVR